MITQILVIMFLALPPSLHGIPPEAMPYVQQCRNEPEWIRWYMLHRDEPDMWNTFIRDGSVSARSRQRAWQVKRKVAARR